MMNQANVTKRRMARKSLVVLALLVCSVAVLAVGGTLAYFTAEETAQNVITTGFLSMELHEETTDGAPWPDGGIGHVVPLTVVDKVVTIRNNGSVPFYARVIMDKVVYAQDGTELPFEHITLDINTEQWIEQDGYYYYYRALQPGEETEPLMTTVTFEATMGNEYMNARVEIDVYAQAVQSANNGDDPLAALGWSDPAQVFIDAIEAPAE